MRDGPEHWHDYQERAAAHFRALGLNAEVDAIAEGARGKHAVDVLVTFTRFGVDHMWIVECKRWKNRVGKAEVLVLLEVIADVGADRGFLLSEEGFQSGAIASSRWTNVTLSNLEDLEQAAADDHYAERLASIDRALADAERTMHSVTSYTGFDRISPRPGLDVAAVLDVHADAMALGIDVRRALAGQSTRSTDRAASADRASVIANLEVRVERLRASADRLTELAREAHREATHALADLKTAIDAFLREVGIAIEHKAVPATADDALRHAAEAMPVIAAAASRIREFGPGTALASVTRVMRHLIDSTYVAATDPALDAAALAETRSTSFCEWSRTRYAGWIDRRTRSPAGSSMGTTVHGSHRANGCALAIQSRYQLDLIPMSSSISAGPTTAAIRRCRRGRSSATSSFGALFWFMRRSLWTFRGRLVRRRHRSTRRRTRRR